MNPCSKSNFSSSGLSLLRVALAFLLVQTSVLAACDPAPSGLVSWWPAEANANDAAGTNNGTVQGALTFGPGKVGQAFVFDGSDAAVRIDPGQTLNVGVTNGFTLEAWINPSTSQAGPICEWNNNGAAVGTGFWVFSLGTLYANVVDTTGTSHVLISNPNVLTPGVFQHVALTYNRTNGVATLYCNGVIVSQQTIGQFVPQTSYRLYIGQRTGPVNPTTFAGSIDELSLYNRALMSAEIQGIFSAGSTGKCPVGTLPAVPVITSFTPALGVPGTNVTLTGLNFSPAASNNIVRFGAVQAAIVSASSNQLVVTVPFGATYAPITETVNGLTAYADQAFLPTFLGNGSSLSLTNFATRLDLPTTNGPFSLIVADVDGDGKPDLIVANVYASSISIYRNISTNGPLSTASFAPPIELPTPNGTLSPLYLRVADIDGDGKLDIIAADYGNAQVSVYRNTSTPGNLTVSSFSNRVDLAVGTQPQGLAIQDLDGDGKPDLLVANSGDGTLSIFRNIGTAGTLTTNSFAPPMIIPMGAGCNFVTTGDLDGDGTPDVMTANYGTNTLSLLRNISTPGNLAFAPRADISGLAQPQQVAIGDIDQDGKPDLIATFYQASIVSVFRNVSTNGTLTASSFAPRIDYPLGGWAHAPALGDLTGDGKPDLAVTSENNSFLSLFQNLSTPGSFTNSSLGQRLDLSTGNNPWNENIADLDGDGRPEIVFCNQYDNTISIYQNETPFGAPPVITAQPTNETVVVGGNASFSVTATGTGPLTYQWSFKSITITGATNATLAFDNVQPVNAGNYAVLVSDVFGSVLSSNALLTVASASPTVPVITSFSPALGVPGTNVTLIGLNFSSITSNNIVRFGAVQATVVSATATHLVVTVPSGATYAPITETVNGLTAYADQAFLPTFFGNGSPLSLTNFAARLDLPATNGPFSVAIADLDGDGKPDVIVANVYATSISIYRNISTNGTLTAASFAPRVDLSTPNGGLSPFNVRVADIDGDGKLDLVVANYGDNSVSVYRNTSTPGNLTASSFSNRVDFAAGSQPARIAIADLDGDGKPDLAVANNGDGTLSILRNTSTPGVLTTNSFAPQIVIPSGAICNDVVAGDLDGDGLPDLATANYGTNTLSLFRNVSIPGNIAFAPRADISVPNEPQQLAIGDIDQDGKPDLIAAFYQNNNLVSVFRNVGTTGTLTAASFAPRIDFPLGGAAHTPALGDLNGDGKPDLAVSTELNSLLSVFQNTSTPGSFTNNSLGQRIDFTTGTDPGGVILADLDGDGRPEIIFCNQNSGSVSIYQNQSPFSTPPAPPVITAQPTNETVVVGGNASFSVTATGPGSLTYQWSFNSNSITGATNATLSLSSVQLTNAGIYSVLVTGTYGSALSSNALLTVTSPLPTVPVITSFTPALGVPGTNVTLIGLNFSSITSNNIVRFGAVQAAVVSATATHLVVTVPSGATYAPITETVNGLTAYADQAFLPTFFGNGSPLSLTNFAARLDLPATNGPFSVAIADLDGDGKPDVIVANVYATSISIYRNISTNGTLTAASFAPRVDLSTPNGGLSPFNVRVADIDGDGKLDLVVANYGDNSVSVYRNTSTPGNLTASSFSNRVDFAAGSQPARIAIADLDGDGKPDLAVANNGDGTLSILRNTSTPGVLTTNSFAPQIVIPSGAICNDVVAGDLDGDGLPDLATANYGTNTLSLFRNVSIPGNIAFAPRADISVPNEPQQLAIGDIDQDGKPDLIAAFYQNNNLVSVFRNVGTTGTLTAASFAPRIDFPLGGAAHTPALGDLNGDGKPDLAVSTELNSLLSVFQNTSTPGSFTNNSLGQRIDFTTGTDPGGVILADLDGDGRPEIIFCNQNSGSVSIYQNQSPFSTPPAPPVITAQPTNETVVVGGNASFSVTATGPGSLTYQWSFNSNSITGATNATLSLSSVQLTNAGIYSVLVTGTYGSALSSNAQLTVTSSSTCEPPPANIVAWWPAEGNGQDIVGSHLATVPTNVTYAAGEVGQGFSFNGSQTSITVADAPDLNFGAGQDFSLESWVKPLPAPGNNPPEVMIIAFKRFSANSAQYVGYGLYLASGQLYFIMGDAPLRTGGLIVNAGPDLRDGNFHHVGVTMQRNSTTGGHLYVDGTNVLTFDPTPFSGSLSNSETFLIGNQNTAGYQTPFNGVIDELSVYSRALAPTEMQAIYNAGSAGKCLSITAPQTLDHFSWSNLVSPRFVNVPFAAVIQARDASNAVVTNFTGTVTLSSTNGTPVSPSVSTNFVQGIWNGTITISQPATNLVLRADDGLGHFGLANPVNVVVTPMLERVIKGNTLTLSWPARSPAFILECSHNLASTNWVPVVPGPTQLNGTNVMIISLSEANCFYRLHCSAN